MPQIGSLFDSLTGQLDVITEHQHSYGKAAQTQADTLMGRLTAITEQQDASRTPRRMMLERVGQSKVSKKHHSLFLAL